MSKIIPTVFTAPARAEFGQNETIDSGDWADLIEAHHYTWSRQGARFPALVFSTAFQTASIAYTQTNSAFANAPGLESWLGLSTLLRDGAARVEGTVAFFAQNLTLQLELIALDTGAVLATAATATGMVSNYATVKTALTLANNRESGSLANPRRQLGYRLKARTGGSGTGYLWIATGYESIFTVADLP